MTWWQYPLLFVAVAVLGIVGEAVRGWASTRSARRAPGRIRTGRPVRVPVVVATDRGRRGWAVPHGDDLRVVGHRVSFVLDRAEVATASVRRDHLDMEHVELAELRGFVDDTGRPVFLGPDEEWVPAFEALAQPPHAAPRAPAARRLRLAAAVPRLAVALGVVALGVAGAFQIVWWTGNDVRATVTRVEVDEEGFGDCSVRWEAADGGDESATVDCYDPLPDVGAEIVVRALAWPFTGEAMDDEGSYEGLTTVTGGAALVLLLGAVGTGLVRASRPARRLTALPSGDITADTAAPPGRLTDTRAQTGLAPAAHVDALPLRELARRVSVLEGWADEAHPAPPPPSTWRVLRDVALTPAWWVVVPLVVVALAFEDTPDIVRVGAGAVAVVLVLRNSVRAVQTVLVMRAAGRAPVTSEWDYLVVRGIADEWYLFLLLGQTPHWSLVLPQGRHPAGQGRCGVRGDLVDGGAVQVVVAGETWVPLGPVMRETEEGRDLLRGDLVARLGPVGLGGRTDAAALDGR